MGPPSAHASRRPGDEAPLPAPPGPPPTPGSLTLNQIIRSAIPVVTCVLAIFVEDKWPTREELTSLVTLTMGVMLAVWQGAVSGRPYAIGFCITGTVCNGAMMTFRCDAAHNSLPAPRTPCTPAPPPLCSGKLLKEKLDVVRLTFYTAPVSLACLAPFFVVYEVRVWCWRGGGA